MPFRRAKLTADWKPRTYPKEFRHLGDHIRARRLDLGLQIKQLSTELDSDEGSVAAWEAGIRKPSLSKIAFILKFLGNNPLPKFESIDRQIKSWRTARGMSQKLLAKQIGFDPSTLASWENGKKKPGTRFLERIRAPIDAHESSSCAVHS